MRAPHSATVTIFGETFALSGEETPERIRQDAAIVDQTMRAIAEGRVEPYGRDNPDPHRIAVLAALNLASRLLAAEPAARPVSITRNFGAMVRGRR